MKLYVFGSCSGTEPFENRHHTSLAFEIGGRYYWFDAGECCSHTAHLMGVDLLRISDIFISHPHMDHVGGLANLLWTIRKIYTREKRLPESDKITVHISNEKTFDGTMQVLRQTENGYKCAWDTVFKKITDSVLLKNEDIEVEAIHNGHMPEADYGFPSYSFRVRAEGKTVIYSGDVKDLSDLAVFLKDGCDALIMETGHHKAEEICSRIIESGYNVGKLYFVHHGRGILNDYDGTNVRCKQIFADSVICNDKDVFDI